MTKQPESITVTIVRTFTPADDPFGLFSLRKEAGNLDNAVSELRWDTIGIESIDNVAELLNDAEWSISEK